MLGPDVLSIVELDVEVEFKLTGTMLMGTTLRELVATELVFVTKTVTGVFVFDRLELMLVDVVMGERRTIEVMTSVVGPREECESVMVEVEIASSSLLLLLGCSVSVDVDIASSSSLAIF